MVLLPHDIWLNVASFVKPSSLESLMSLNSTFFHLAMDIRYRQISFAFLDNNMLRNLVRLQDPVVARRVRVLHISPTFLSEVLDTDREKNSLLGSLRSRLAELSSCMGRVYRRNDQYRHQNRRMHKFRTASDVLESLLSVLSGLPNVTCYHVIWCGLPHSIPDSLGRVFSSAFQPSLRKLSLDIALENVVELFRDHDTCLQSLEELDFVIRHDHSADPSTHAFVLRYHLATAISRISKTLRKLSIQLWEPFDLSPFFFHIKLLPSLAELTLSIPTSSPYLGNPLGVVTFLRRQASSLRSLSLRITEYTKHETMLPCLSLTGWICCALARYDVRLPHLSHLTICARDFPPEALNACIRHFAPFPSLKSFTLAGAHHQYTDVAAVLDSFSCRPPEKRLENLHLGAVTLTPRLLDLFARELPKLHRLELLVREIAPWDDDELLASGKAPLRFYENQNAKLVKFFALMQHRRYSNWHLSRFKFTVPSLAPHFPFNTLEQLFSHAIPTITGFS